MALLARDREDVEEVISRRECVGEGEVVVVGVLDLLLRMDADADEGELDLRRVDGVRERGVGGVILRVDIRISSSPSPLTSPDLSGSLSLSLTSSPTSSSSRSRSSLSLSSPSYIPASGVSFESGLSSTPPFPPPPPTAFIFFLVRPPIVPVLPTVLTDLTELALDLTRVLVFELF